MGMPEKEVPRDDLRCHRTDGRQWRCKRRAMEGKKMCELHHLQLSLRQHKQKVPESLKLVRTSQNRESPAINPNSEIRAQKSAKLGKSAKTLKRKRVVGESEALDEAVRNMKLKRGDSQLELIRMVLKRELEKKKKPKKKKKKKKEKKSDFDCVGDSDGELMRVLPNGVMAISSSPSPNRNNAPSSCDVKLGVEPISVIRRRFRSKNIERLPVGTMQVVPYKGNLVNSNKEKRKRCHWCGKKGLRSLISCSSCKRQFFCIECIEARHIGWEEVEKECPVCRGTCRCKACSIAKSRDTECKGFLKNEDKVGRILHLHYLICMLLPVLKQMNKDQSVELEREAKMKGQNPTELQIHVAQSSSNERDCCVSSSNCMASIVDLHRSCTKCSYNLCLSCCGDLSQRGLPGNFGPVICKCTDERKFFERGPPFSENQSLSPSKSTCNLVSSSCELLPNCKTPDGNVAISCPPGEVGEWDDGLLGLRSLFPWSWTKKLEISAEEIVSSYELPETLDKFSSCSLCFVGDNQIDSIKHLQEAARRDGSIDNYLYYPNILDLHNNNLEHFQKHWSQGHPVIVQNTLQSTSDLSWDPITLFCTYLKNSNGKSQNDVHNAISCLDWFEVEIGIKQLFSGSLRGQTEANTCHEKLKLNGWVSSHLFQEQFPAHYADIVNALPLPHYMDPNSGLLNIAAKLRDRVQTPDLGPCLSLSYSSGEELVQADSVSKLSFDFYDVVNILVHATDAPVSTKQICRIRKLMKKQKAQDQREGNNWDHAEIMNDKVKSSSSLSGKNIQELGLQKKQIPDRTAKQPSLAASTWDLSLRERDTSHAGKNWSDTDCSSDSESSEPCSGTKAGPKRFEYRGFHRQQRESCNQLREKENSAKSGCAQWDVFRRQDVPKLLEYLRNHSHEFSHTYSYPKNMCHPSLDQSFSLDTYHKMRLKKEFDIEPWTFEQHIGEAVMIPAGCPYQIRTFRSCVNVVLKFLSPENVMESIRRTDELWLLPGGQKAKAEKLEVLEVTRMAIHSISAAIGEIRGLTSA